MRLLTNLAMYPIMAWMLVRMLYDGQYSTDGSELEREEQDGYMSYPMVSTFPYTVREGETLATIAKEHETTPEALYRANMPTIDEIIAGEERRLITMFGSSVARTTYALTGRDQSPKRDEENDIRRVYKAEMEGNAELLVESDKRRFKKMLQGRES